MKLLHCADVHLGSAFERFDPKVRSTRKAELRATFDRMVDYALSSGASAILICGDLFDVARPSMDDKRFFYSKVASNPGLNFYYLRGNHDTEEGFDEPLPNLFTFGEGITEYELGDVRIAGCEISSLEKVYTDYNPEPGRANILMLHGQLVDGGSSGGPETIYKNRLEGKNLSYLALGHIHYYSAVPLGRGVAVYSGCLEGRGYDETGARGFVMIDIDGDKVTHEFVPFAKRVVLEAEVDLAGTANVEEAMAKISSEAGRSPENMMRLILKGEVPYSPEDAVREARARLSGAFFDLSVKSVARQADDLSALEKNVSLRGEFYRIVMADGTIPDNQKEEVIRLGLRLLDGEVAGL